MEDRSDGKSCNLDLLFDPNFKGTLCPRCGMNNYSMTLAYTTHNSIRCFCGWHGCECELLENDKDRKTIRTEND